MSDATELPVIQIRIRIQRPLEEVWELFMDPITMLQWLGNEISSDFHEGGGITFRGKNAPTTPEIGDRWIIKKIREDNVILFSWEIFGVETLFVIRFREIGPGTVMEVKHGPVPAAARDYHLPEHWTLLLANFKAVLELGGAALRFDYSKYHPTRITHYDSKDVRLSVLIRAPPSLPFDVWTNPEKLKHFIRAENPVVDDRYGGLYTWWAEGMGPVVFTKMEPDSEIEFSWVYQDEPETRVNVRFEPVDDDTLVALHHYGFQKPEDVVGYHIGWASILAELKLVCELGESGIERISDWEI
ncbi:hypothetical protein EU538_04580 [Candidatus Thorarchaeota archaeon]|jgi:uncharacterized protein YndB with AHSA1/START domain|nr:MAG: hypothetical protein EU538_04580 [Candidatus Thorarchaeota archaeon]